MDLVNLHRVYSNVIVFLDNGQFAGQAAPAIVEARALISGVVADLEKTLNEQREEEERARIRRESDTCGMDTDRVSNRGRSRRRKKNDGT